MLTRSATTQLFLFVLNPKRYVPSEPVYIISISGGWFVFVDCEIPLFTRWGEHSVYDKIKNAYAAGRLDWELSIMRLKMIINIIVPGSIYDVYRVPQTNRTT